MIRAWVCKVVTVEWTPPSPGSQPVMFIEDCWGITDSVLAPAAGERIDFWEVIVAGYCRTEEEAKELAAAKVVRPDLNDRDSAKFCVVLYGEDAE